MVSVCLLGSGFIADAHRRGYAHVDSAEVTAVVSPDGAETFIEEQNLDAEAFRDFESALDAVNSGAIDVDAVDVCTPTNTHRDCVVRAVTAGLPVICEKPLASTLDDAAAIRNVVTDADVPVMVAHVIRFFPQYIEAKKQVDAGKIGTPGVARARRLSSFPDWSEWYADRDISGGVFLDLAIHDLDFLRWVFGDVERVFARRVREDRLEHGIATLAFENGATGYVEASWAQPDSREFTFGFEFAGDEGVLDFDGTDDSPVQEFADEATAESPLADQDGYARELRHFIECVETGADPAIDVDDAIEAMRLSKAAERSADRGEPVELSEVDV